MTYYQNDNSQSISFLYHLFLIPGDNVASYRRSVYFKLGPVMHKKFKRIIMLCFCGRVFDKTVGFPMGPNCASILPDPVVDYIYITIALSLQHNL